MLRIAEPELKIASDLSENPDYQEAFNNRTQGGVYMGSLSGQISRIRKDVVEKKENSAYFGQIFCPERPNRADYDEAAPSQWSYEKNMSFMAGAIAARAEFTLVTPITSYGNKKIGITTHELLWLKDNGYTFKSSPRNTLQTIAIPPVEKVPPIFKFYQDEAAVDVNPEAMLEGIRQIKADVEREKKELARAREKEERKKRESARRARAIEAQARSEDEIRSMMSRNEYVRPGARLGASNSRPSIGSSDTSSMPALSRASSPVNTDASTQSTVTTSTVSSPVNIAANTQSTVTTPSSSSAIYVPPSLRRGSNSSVARSQPGNPTLFSRSRNNNRSQNNNRKQVQPMPSLPRSNTGV